MCSNPAHIKAYSRFQTPAKPIHAPDAPALANQDDVEEVEVVTVHGGEAVQKRKLNTEQDSRANKRLKSSAGEDERRLAGDYMVPKGARSIFVPGYEDSNSDRETTQPARSTGMFKPRNTLGHKPHAARPNHKNDHIFREYAEPRLRQAQQSLAIQSSRGDNVAERKYANGGDGFEDEYMPSAKKQKLNNSIPPSPVVDLTQENEVGTPSLVGLNGKKVPGKSQRTLPWSQEDRATQSFWTVHNIMNGPEPKARRKSKGASQSSQQESGQASPVLEVVDHGSASSNRLKEQTSVVVIEDESQERPEPRQSRRTIPQDMAMSSERPVINLEKGFSDIEKQFERGSKADMDTASTVMENVSKRKSKGAHGNDSKLRQDHRRLVDGAANYSGQQTQVHAPDRDLGRNGRSPEPGSFERYLANGQPTQDSEQRLADTLKPRRSIAAGVHKQSASQRMQAESKRRPNTITSKDRSSGSADELAGETTVRSQGSRSVSPQKPAVFKFPPQRFGARNPTPKRQHSPSDLQPTEFTQSTKRTRRDSSEPRSSPTNTSPHDSNKVRMLAFYATSCVLTSGDMALLYDEQDRTFDVLHNDNTVTIPGRLQVVSLGPAEVRKVLYAKDCERVCVLGSSTMVSTGHIVIAFQSYEDVKWFLDVVAATEVTAVENETLDHVNKLFAKQAQEITQAWEKLKRRVEKSAMAGLAERKVVHSVAQGQERIRYDESNLEESRNSARTRMRDGDSLLENVLYRTERRDDGVRAPAGTQSRYFPDQSNPRRSTRQTQPTKEKTPPPPPPKWTQVNKVEPWKRSIVYPPEGLRRVTVDFADLERLDEGEFLNDNVISFALRQMEESMAPEYKESVHFFNTFFYSAMTSKNGKKAFNYDAVKRWTKKKDIFSVPFVVVPINIDLHWFVAIICNLPNLSRKAAGMDDDEPERLPEQVQSDVQLADLEEPNSSAVAIAGSDEQPAQTETTEAMDHLSLSDKEAAGTPNGDVFEFGDDGRVAAEDDPSRPSTAASKKSGKRGPPPLKKYDTEMPIIITLDSFGSSHSTEVRYLKEYLCAEADAKRGMSVELKQLQGMTAKGIPEQPNFFDCGVYLVGYVEQFAKNPKQFVDKVLSRQLDEQIDFAHFDPSRKRAEIREALLKLSKQLEEDHKVQKKQKARPQEVQPTGASEQIGDAAKPPVTPTEKREPESVETRDRLTQVKMPLADWSPVPRPTDQLDGRPSPADAVTSTVGVDEADLDMAPPRALEKITLPGIPETRAIEAEAAHAAPPKAKTEIVGGQGEEDEMLDDVPQIGDADRQLDGARSSPAPTDALEHTLQHGQLTGRPAKAHVEAADGNGSSEATQEEEEPPEVQSTRLPMRHPDLQEQQRPAEIADSQEHAVASVPEGKHFKFDD